MPGSSQSRSCPRIPIRTSKEWHSRGPYWTLQRRCYFTKTSNLNRNANRILSRVGRYAWWKWRVLVPMIGFIIPLVHSLLIRITTAISLIYTFYSSTLHTHLDSPSSLVVCWQRISTLKLALQITMKSSLWNLGTKNSSGLTPPTYNWLATALELSQHSLLL
jgi:hypothetical protein